MNKVMVFLSLLFCACAAQAHEGFFAAGPDGHAPLGVMGDHTHNTGEWMFSYRYMFMQMDGNRDGTDRVSAQEIVSPTGDGFIVTPTKMDVQMHMFGAMYAINDRVTLMGMLPYVIKEMDHLTRSGARFSTKSEGIGDFKTSALVRLVNSNSQALHLNLGLSLPTGSINEKDDNPRCQMMGNCPAQLPYPMQIGSGTVDPSIGLTWLGDNPWFSWGAQAMGTFRLGHNDKEYSQGELYEATVWAAKPVSSRVSLSARLGAMETTNYDSEDEDLEVSNTNFITTGETNLRGGARADVGVGLNWLVGGGVRLAAEVLYPFYQNLDGPQLESDGMVLFGLQYTGGT